MAQSIECVYSVEGSGPPVIFVHGIGSRRQGWSEIVSKLRDRFHCLTYDLRGHGESPMPTGTFGLDELVSDLEALRRKCGLEAFHIVGHSLGGMIGPAYARKYPGRVKSLTLLSTAAFRTEEDSAKVNGVVDAMEEKGIPPLLDTLADRWFTDAFAKANADRIEARKKQVIETDAGVFLNVFRIYATTEMGLWLHEIRAPSFVMTGELDGGCNPRLNKQIAAALPQSKLVILNGLKHSILVEAPDEIARQVGGFLAENS